MKTTTLKTIKTKARTKLSDYAELKLLKRQINDGHEAVESFCKSIKEKQSQALSEAITIGKALEKVKGIVGHGGFVKWCKENCKKISHVTITKYMKLAKFNHGENLLTTYSGLREAYIGLGIIEENTSSKNTDSGETLGGGGTQKPALTVIGKVVASQATSSPTTPTANKFAKATGRSEIKTALPQISTEDQLSRLKFLTGELIGELNNKITIKGVTLNKLESIALKPLADWFKAKARNS